MTDEQKQAVENIRQAIAGRPSRAYAEVSPADVIAAATAVKEPDAVTEGLRAGALGAGPRAETVHQLAGQLAHLVAKAGGP